MPQKLMNKALSVEDVFRKFFDLAIDLFLVTDEKGNILKFSPAWERLLGYTPGEITGKQFMDFVHPDDRERTLETLGMVFNVGGVEGFTNKYISKSGKTVHLEWRALLEDNLVYAVGRDVTNWVESESELKKSRETYQFITENMSDVIWIMDPLTMQFTYLSPSVKRLRGFTVEEVMNQSIEEVVTPESAVIIAQSLQEGMQGYFTKGEFYEKTVRVEQPVKGGGTVWTEVVSRLLKDTEGNLRILGVTRNITENLKMENELKQKNTELQLANNTRNKLLSVISHDLRSPFHPILNMSDILLTDLEILTPKEIKQFSEDIHNSAVKVVNLLENLLKWTRVQAGALQFNPVTVDMQSLIKETLSSIKQNLRAKDISVNTVLAPGTTIEGDASMLQSIIQNLLTNAVKFSHPGSSIDVSLTSGADHVVLTVTDYGVGMTEEQKTRLFVDHEIASTPGTSNEKGSGLGLNLCIEFVAKHNGTIDVESQPGTGTKFIVKLPK